MQAWAWVVAFGHQQKFAAWLFKNWGSGAIIMDASGQTVWHAGRPPNEIPVSHPSLGMALAMDHQ
jgi:hypothetical protein